MCRRARFAENAATTARSLRLALLLAYGIGLAIGVWMGAHRLSGAVGEPILVALYSLPKIVLYPVVLLIFGLGISGKVAFGAMHGILPVALLTMGAIRAIPPVYLRAARTLQLSPWQTIVNVLLPAALPEVFTGLRIGFTVTLLGVLLGEMFASKQGLGSMIMTRHVSSSQGEEMMTVAIVLFAFAAVANAAAALDRASAAPADLRSPSRPFRAGVVLEPRPGGKVEMQRIDVVGQDDEARLVAVEQHADHDKRARLHAGARARHTVGQQLERVMAVERRAHDTHGLVGMAIERFGERRPCLGRCSIARASAARTSARMQSMWICSWFCVRAKIEFTASPILSAGITCPSDFSTKRRASHAAAK